MNDTVKMERVEYGVALGPVDSCQLIPVPLRIHILHLSVVH